MKRKSKKYISNNLIAVLIVIFGIIMAYNNWLIYKNAEKFSATGLVVAKGSLTLTIKTQLSVIGNISSITTTISNLNFLINNTIFSSGLDQITGVNKVNFTKSNFTLISFDFNFSTDSSLDMSKIKINETFLSGVQGILISGINLTSQGTTKTVYINRTNATYNAVCVKDTEINSIDEMTADCSANDEIKLACDGIITNGYICTLEGTFNKISGLKNSGLKQISFTRPSEAPSGGAGGGGGGAGGGGGGGGLIPIPKQEILPSFKIDKDLIKISLKEDQSITESLSITNDGNVKLNLNLKIKDLEEFISLSDYSINLELGETKIITLKITGKLSGAYSGKLLIENTEISK